MSDPDKLPEHDGVWNPARALANLTMEKALDGNSPQQMAKRLFEECLPVAVMGMCHLAVYSDSEVVRFNAQKYVVERTMGPAERIVAAEGKHAWDNIYENVVDEAEGYLKQ